MVKITKELKMIIEHRITTLLAFASISLYANIFIFIRMAKDNPSNKMTFFLINIAPFELFIFIEGNLFLAKYVQTQKDESVLKAHFWAFLCCTWYILFWVFLPPLSLLFLWFYNDIDRITQRRRLHKVVNAVLVIASIITFLCTVTLTRVLSYEKWSGHGMFFYALYIWWWIYTILFIAFRPYIKYLNYVQFSTFVVILLYLSKSLNSSIYFRAINYGSPQF